MSQFSYFNEINSLTSMDGPINRGPMPRWQRKQEQNSSKLSTSALSLSSLSFNASTSNVSKGKKTPSKTPSKSKPNSRSTTPTPNKNAKTPVGGDRFIPLRKEIDFELAHYKLTNNEDNASPATKEKQRILSENMRGVDITKQRILAYQNKAPSAPKGYMNPFRVVYTQTRTPAATKPNSRYIPNQADRILDAPDIINDYYLNLVDWGQNNIVAVALGTGVYLWNSATGAIEELVEYTGDDHPCSLKWIQDGDHLAVGLSTGHTELWDCTRLKKLRTMDGHSARVGALDWNSYIVSSGSRSGAIIHHDVRQREHAVAVLQGHSQEVCGLRWSPDGRFLASGGNDNVLNIWAQVPGQKYTSTTPLYTFNAHQAAVKALAWCPWHQHVLASGGGTADRTIRFWNCNTGVCMNTIDTKSQVCSLVWSTTFKEIVSGHGFANNQIILWKYPSMTKVSELNGHTARVLHLALSPDGTTLLSAAADETLRFWNCFTADPSLKKKEKSVVKESVTSMFSSGIR